MNFFVQVVYDGVPGQLFGPTDYSNAVQTALKVLEKGKNQHGPVEVDDHIREAVELDGFYNIDNFGVFVVQPEDYSDEG